MRVLHAVPSLAPGRGGPTAVIRALVPAQLARGDEVTVLSTRAGLDGAGQAAVARALYPARTVFVDTIGSDRLELAPMWIPRLLQELRTAEVVHVHTIFTFPVAATAWLAARRVPVVIRPAGTLDEICLRSRSEGYKRLAIRTYVGAALDGAAALHATSALEAGDLARLRPGAQVITAELGAAAIDVPADPGGRGRRIATLGRLHPLKGIERLLDALAHLPDDVELELGGDGAPAYRAELERRAQHLGLAARVRFLGHLDGAAQATLLARASLLCFPSHHESFGVAVVEAMAAGRAIVVSRTVGIAPTLEQAGAASVSDGKARPLAAAIGALLDDGKKRLALAERGRALARSRYTWTAAAERIAALYDEALRRRSRPRSIGVAGGSWR